MALPVGVTTATITFGVPVSFTGGAVRSTVSIVPSASLVHTATGTPLVNFIEDVITSEGVSGQFTLPHTDQLGFQDESGNSYQNWYYTATISYSAGKTTLPPRTKTFQLPTGQTTVDLDLLPAGAPVLPYTAATANVTSLNGSTGAVTVDKTTVGLGSVDNTSDASKPVSTAQATALALKADKALIPLNVRDAPYNAVGDGVANDTAAIQAALNTTRDVYIPPGTYRLVAATGFALSNTSQRKRRIFGAGDATLLKMDSGGEGGVLDATGATVSDLAIDGGFTPAVGESNLLSCVQANSNSTVQNCHIYNARGSCLVGVGSRIAFINNRLEKFGDHAIYFSGDIGTASPFNILATSSRLVVSGNIIDDDPTYHTGAAGGPVRGAIKFRNNIIDAVVSNNTIAGDQCILIDGDTRRAEACPRRIVVTGNTLLASYSGLQINTTIDGVAGDLGFRVSEVTVSGNTVYGSDADNTGVNLSRARANITNNLFLTTAGISNFETGDTGASVITGNTFRSGVTGIYKAGTGSLIEGNLFEGLTGGWAVQCTYHNTIRGNVFSGCATAAVLRTATHATNVLLIQDNMFMNNTLAMDVGEFARSVALLDNVFTGNTTTATVITGASFNGFTTANNRVISGGAFPVAGSTDTIALAPVTPVATVSALPAAASGLRGRMVRVVGGAGVADQAYICRKNAADVYEWAPVL